MTFIILTPALACPSLAKQGDPVEVLLVARKKKILDDLSCLTYSPWKKKKEKTLDRNDVEILPFILSDHHISKYVVSAYRKKGFREPVRARIRIPEKAGLYQLNNPFREDIPDSTNSRSISFLNHPPPEAPSFLGEEPIRMHHPFYIGVKDYLNIAHISDSHLAARMWMLEERWNANYNDAWHQSLIVRDRNGREKEKPGDFSNYNTQFMQNLEAINANKTIDIIIHTGDITDYNRGYCSDKGGNDLARDYYLDRNWLLFYEILCHYYEKPFFSVLGNHDYRLHPYAPNPVVISRRIWELFNMAPTVNLTRSEMNVLHGDPHSLNITRNHLITAAHAVRWYSMVLNPLLDYQVFYGRMAFLMLDWNRWEDHERGTPWAREALSQEQWSMIENWHKNVMDRRRKEKIIAVVAMHPAVFNPFPEMGDRTLRTNPETSIFYESMLIDTYNENDLVDGTFRLRRNEFIRLCLGNKEYGKNGDYHISPERGIDLILTGHAHRSGVFQIEGPHVYLRTDSLEEGPLFCNAISSGPIGIRNEEGGSERVQLHPPGYHVIYIGDTIFIDVRNSPLIKIREVSRRDFGEVARGMSFEVLDTVGIPPVNRSYRWKVINLRDGSTITRIRIATGFKGPVKVTKIPLGWRYFLEKVNGFATIVCEAHDRGQGIFHAETGEICIEADHSTEKMGILAVSWDMADDLSLPVCVRVPAD